MTSESANFTVRPVEPESPSRIVAAVRFVKRALDYRDGMAATWSRADVPTPAMAFCRGGMRCCIGSIIVDAETTHEDCPFCQRLQPHVANTGPERLAFSTLLVGGH